MDIKTFHSTLIKHAEDLFKRKGELPAACFAVLPNDDVICLCRQFKDNAEKEYTMRMYSMILEFVNASMYSMVTEFYFYSTKDADNFIAPSKHPDRKEGIGIFTIDRNDEKLLYNVEIKNKKILHNETMLDAEFDGRFSHLFMNMNDKQREIMQKEVGFAHEMIKNLEWYIEIPKKDFFHTDSQ